MDGLGSLDDCIGGFDDESTEHAGFCSTSDGVVVGVKDETAYHI